MSGVATMHPQPALPPRLGSAHRGSSGERAETVTAGITDWAPAGLLRAQGQPGLGRGPGLPEPFRAPGRQVDTGVPQDPTDTTWHQLPPRRAGLPTPEVGRAPRNSPAEPPSPNSTSAPSPGPNLFGLASRQRKGCGPGTPALGAGAMTPDSSPPAERKGQPESGLLPTHLSGGPVFGSGSSDVRVAAT